MISIHEEREKMHRANTERARKRNREEARQLVEIAEAIVARYQNERDISPLWVATEAMAKVGATASLRKDKPLLYLAGHLEFRQITRGVCRKKWEAEDDLDGGEEQHELFPGLQKRYPIAKEKGQEPVYRLLEHMSHEDLIYNINRLCKEAGKKLEHADLLVVYDKHKYRLEEQAS